MGTQTEISRRTRRYWMVDGLAEIMMGCVMLLLSAAQLLALSVPAAIGGFARFLFPMVVLAIIPFQRRIINAVKTRITYPRTGYVEYPEPKRWHQLLGAILGFCIGAGLTLLLFYGQLSVSVSWLPLITGCSLALAMTYLAFYFGMPRFYGLALFAVVAGILLWYLHIDGFVAGSVVSALVSLWLLIAGGITLRRYLQQTQRMGQEYDEDRA